MRDFILRVTYQRCAGFNRREQLQAADPGRDEFHVRCFSRHTSGTLGIPLKLHKTVPISSYPNP